MPLLHSSLLVLIKPLKKKVKPVVCTIWQYTWSDKTSKVQGLSGKCTLNYLSFPHQHSTEGKSHLNLKMWARKQLLPSIETRHRNAIFNHLPSPQDLIRLKVPTSTPKRIYLGAEAAREHVPLKFHAQRCGRESLWMARSFSATNLVAHHDEQNHPILQHQI